MNNRFYREHKSVYDTIDGFLLKNTVLEKGLVVAPVVVVSSSLKNGVALALAFSILTFFTVFATSFIPKSIPHSLRVIIAVLFAGALYIPTSMLIDLWFPGTSYQLGVFLPLMITNSLIVWRSESRFHKEKKSRMALDLFFHILGFWAVICVVGAVREIWGNGTLWENQLDFVKNPIMGILLPFFGFIIVGFLAALLHKYRNYLIPMDKDGILDLSDGTQPFGYQTLPASAVKRKKAPEASMEREVAADE